MTWYVHGITAMAITASHECCKHLKVGETAPRYFAECHTFGRETYYMCVSCYDALQAHRMNDLLTCDDCNGTVPRHRTIEWEWHDFDNLQGDTALCICVNCQSLPPHLRRVEQS